MKPNLQKNQNIPNISVATSCYEWQKRSNSHNVISEYNIFMTPRGSNPNFLESKHLETTNKPPPISPNTSQNSQLQHFEYLTLQKPQKNQFKLPIKEMLKSYSGLNFNEKKSPKFTENIPHIYNLPNEEKTKWFNSLTHRGPENHSLELMKPSPRKTSPIKNEEETSKSIGKGSFDLNFVSSTSNKIRKMLMTSPYNSSKALVNSLKSLKNLSHGNLLSDDIKNTNYTTNFHNTKQNKGFLSNFNFSRKNLVKLAASNHYIANKGGLIEKTSNERNVGKTKDCKAVIQEESTFKNSTSYKSTHNTSKSADKLKDKQTEELFNLFNRAKCLLYKYKMKEKEWKREKEELLKEIQILKENQRK